MNEIIEIIKNCNWQTILGLFAIAWYIKHEVHLEIHEIRQEIAQMRTEMQLQGQRTDRLYQMFVDLLKERK